MATCEKCGQEHDGTYGSGRFCSKKCASSFSTKNNRELISEKISQALTRPKRIRVCEYCGKTFIQTYKQRFCSNQCNRDTAKTDEYRKRHSELLKGHCGGYREGSGRGKSGWYKGFQCDSSWELAFVIYYLDHNIPIERNKEKFEYIFEGVHRTYIPDFVVEGEYVEIKGYTCEQWREKERQFPHKLKVLYKKEMRDILEYVKETYGNDFISLYDGNPHNKKDNKCVVCGEPCVSMYCSRRCSGVGVSSIGQKSKTKTKTKKRRINQFSLDGKHIRTWESVEDVAKICGLKVSTFIFYLYTNRKNVHGFNWSFEEPIKHQGGQLHK